MNRQACIFILLAFVVGGNALAQSLQREETINRIVELYALPSVLTEDSPVIRALLVPSKSMNPKTNEETWRVVAGELAEALRPVFVGPHSPQQKQTRAALQAMSDQDLSELEQLLSRPSYQKFRTKLETQEAKQEVFDSTLNNGVKATGIMRRVLAKHGLK